MCLLVIERDKADVLGTCLDTGPTRTVMARGKRALLRG